MGKIVSIFNQKGGVGKTTTSINLCAALGRQEKSILLIDMDPQGNASSGLGVEKTGIMMYDVLVGENDIKDGIKKTTAEGVDIVASSNDLAGLEIEFAREGDWNFHLKEALEDIRDGYDFIFIDCPPSLGILSIMSLVASDSVIVPIQCEYYALEGVSQLYDTINLMRQGLNPNLEIEGIVLSMFDGRTNLSIQVAEEVKEYFKGKVYLSIIPRNVRLAEAPSHGLSVIDYDIRSKGAEAYMELGKEFLSLVEE